MVFSVLVFSGISEAEKVCVIDSYGIAVTERVKDSLISYLGKEEVVSYANLSEAKDCRVDVILGSPGVVEALNKVSDSKVVYSFVLFPEALKLDKRENFYGVRIFPLPVRTINKFFSWTGLKREKVAVLVSKSNKKIARLYLPSRFFKVIYVNAKVEEAFPQLVKYKYIYIFPDPVVLKLVNLLSLVSYAKSTGKILIAGLPDLKRYDINFIYAVDFNDLVRDLARLVYSTPSKHILPCPAKVKVWSP